MLVTGSGVCVGCMSWEPWRNVVVEYPDCRSEICAGGGEGTVDKNLKEEGRVYLQPEHLVYKREHNSSPRRWARGGSTVVCQCC